MQSMRQKREKYLEFRCSGRILRVVEPALRTFAEWQQKKGNLEAGGILLGKVFPAYDEIIQATAPVRCDLRKYFSFTRAKGPAQIKIDKAWNHSRGSMIYLGEWHTHRETNPSPSCEDKKMILKSLKETEMETDFLYLIIVGMAGTFWVGRQTSNGLTKFEINTTLST